MQSKDSPYGANAKEENEKTQLSPSNKCLSCSGHAAMICWLDPNALPWTNPLASPEAILPAPMKPTLSEDISTVFETQLESNG